ncbi:hypothetical protein PYW08_002409 [Mythimna loreyi]|uniref:Uncharacterized protein n=1 Tax=Mythimna loreyi TaxID=667449 RepID=A0ACC2R1L3_9NEOP|nr:hypothetical protein PYW08_002409 [Mythimna loreyi]
MFDNDTGTENHWWIYYWKYLLDIMPELMCVLTLAALIYGLTSWCFLKKFQSYRNYVLLNAILSDFFYYLTFSTMKHWIFISSFQLHYFATAKTHWLLVISHMFYVDIVKVFNQNVQRRYLKSCVFGWGVAIITTTISWYLKDHYFKSVPKFHFIMFYYMKPHDWYVYTTILYSDQILPLIINCVLYIVTVFSLCRSFNTSTQANSNICRRLYIATLIFLLSDVALVSTYFIVMVTQKDFILLRWNKNGESDITTELLFRYLNPLLIIVFLVAVRGNRKAWHDFYLKTINQRSSAGQRGRDIVMQPAERYRAVSDV